MRIPATDGIPPEPNDPILRTALTKPTKEEVQRQAWWAYAFALECPIPYPEHSLERDWWNEQIAECVMDYNE